MSAKLINHDEITRANARMLMETAGSSAAFGERVGLSNSQVSQLLGRNPIRNIGFKLARRIEEAFDKPTGWLDVPQDMPAPPQQQTISDRLDLAMREAGFASQAALARASGVPQPTINRILKNLSTKQGPETETLQRLAKACRVTFNWLHQGADEVRVHPHGLTPEQQEWLALLDDLGSEDIEEFKLLIQERQRRNRKLLAELVSLKKQNQ
jgi:transcriptional regulator with XRE-family HTH domain